MCTIRTEFPLDNEPRVEVAAMRPLAGYSPPASTRLHRARVAHRIAEMEYRIAEARMAAAFRSGDYRRILAVWPISQAAIRRLGEAILEHIEARREEEEVGSNPPGPAPPPPAPIAPVPPAPPCRLISGEQALTLTTYIRRRKAEAVEQGRVAEALFLEQFGARVSGDAA